jgi:hypothetical protein
MIHICWVNLPYGRNHPANVKFVVSKSFAIASAPCCYKGWGGAWRLQDLRADRFVCSAGGQVRGCFPAKTRALGRGRTHCMETDF